MKEETVKEAILAFIQGEIAYPVNEVTVAGNLKDMFKALTPASGLQFRYGVDCPTLRIDGMTVAGK